MHIIGAIDMANGFKPLKYAQKKPEVYTGSVEMVSTNAPFGRSWRFRQAGRNVDIEISGTKRFFRAKYSIILKCNNNVPESFLEGRYAVLKADGNAGKAVENADRNVDALKKNYIVNRDEHAFYKDAISEGMMNVSELIGDRRIKSVDVRMVDDAPELVLQKEPFKISEFFKKIFSAPGKNNQAL